MINWQSKIETSCLQSSETHVWCVNTTNHQQNLDKLHYFLNEEEKKRAAKFIFIGDRNNFIIARACLRLILEKYLQKSAEKIIFHTNDFGKLFLTDAEDLQFNLSHSKDLVLYAFTSGQSIGIDVEYTGRVVEYLELAKRFFAADEARSLETLVGDDLRQAFYRIWTKKEAFVKAVGKGLSFSLQDFSVSPKQNNSIETVKIHDVSGIAASDWQVINFELGSGYLAALVRQNELQAISYYEYDVMK